MTKLLATFLATILLIVVEADVQAAYTFADVYSGASSTTFILGYDISDSTVAIHGGDGIFKVTGGVNTSIVKAGDPAPTGTFSLPSFGTVGNVGLSGGIASFHGSYPGSSAIFTGSGGPLTTIASIGDATSEGAIAQFPFTERSSISGNNVAFMAGTSSGLGVYVGSGGSITTIVNAGDPAPSGNFANNFSGAGLGFGGPVISGDRVAFIGSYPGGQGVFAGNGGALTTVAKSGDAAPSGTFTSGSFSQQVLSGDAVAFRANYTGGGGIFVGDGGTLTTIATIGDPAPGGAFSSLTVGGIANNGNDVSFLGQWAGGSGAFVSSGGTIATVIKTGDLLFGQTLTALGLDLVPNKIGLDPGGGGNVVFSYRLSDGTIGVAMATPIPEPNSYALAAALALIVRRRRLR
jgi:hypothetical protein